METLTDQRIDPNLRSAGDAGDAAERFVERRASVDASTRIRRLLLATDLSAASNHAADEAIRLAVESGAQLVVLNVIDAGRLRLPGGIFLRRVDQERARVEIAVQDLVRRARLAGALATYLIWEGDPAEAIVAASDAEDIDVIVMGSHGRGRLGRIVLGSISARVSEDARCRVMIVASP